MVFLLLKFSGVLYMQDKPLKNAPLNNRYTLKIKVLSPILKKGLPFE